MNPHLYTFKELKDFKEKIRLLSRKYDKNKEEIERIINQMKQSEQRKKRLEKENSDLQKQIKKFENIILYAESLFDHLTIPYDRNERKNFKK